MVDRRLQRFECQVVDASFSITGKANHSFVASDVELRGQELRRRFLPQATVQWHWLTVAILGDIGLLSRALVKSKDWHEASVYTVVGQQVLVKVLAGRPILFPLSESLGGHRTNPYYSWAFPPGTLHGLFEADPELDSYGFGARLDEFVGTPLWMEGAVASVQHLCLRERTVLLLSSKSATSKSGPA